MAATVAGVAATIAATVVGGAAAIVVGGAAATVVAGVVGAIASNLLAETHAWLKLGRPFTYPTKPGRDDRVAALAFLSPPAIDMELEPQRTMYDLDEVALGYFASRELWADEAGTSTSGEEAERFPTLVDCWHFLTQSPKIDKKPNP